MTALGLINSDQRRVIWKVERYVDIECSAITDVPSVLFEVQVKNFRAHKGEGCILNSKS